ncbi:MAG: hypothetical protein GY719_07135 [bacterium]|nr:hypothetical protein [bacterium]
MKPRRENGGRAAFLLLLVPFLLLLPGADVAGQDPGEEPGLQLTSPVRQQLRLLTEAWRGWTRAYYQSEKDAAANAAEQLRSIAARLGMSSLPDLSNAASAFAVLAAREDDFERARWVLDSARQLDPDRPEIEFAASTVQRLEGNYFGAVLSNLKGYAALLRLPLERSVWLHNVTFCLFYVLLASGAFFVALQMATKGGALFYDLARFVSPPLALATADLLTIAALLWPVLLPSGMLWLALYWSILLWGYGSLSERLIFVVLWLSLGVAPLLLSYQQRAIQLDLAPPIRAVDHLGAGRLYGSLFSDLGVLRSMMPQSAAVRELTADLHRRFGQWEHARSMYTALLERDRLQGRDAAAADNNLGVYHHRRKEFGTAVNYFRAATEEDPSLAEAFFNLAQAYSQLYKFSDSNLAMARAKEIDRARVNAWERAEVPIEEIAVGVDGSQRRVGQLRAELRATWQGTEAPVTAVDLWRRYLSLSVVAGVVLLALTLHLVRSQMGYRSSLLESRALLPPAADRWLRALVPGLESARQERGGMTLLAILVPATLGMALLTRGLGYRTPLAYDSGLWLSTALSLAGLAVLFLFRLGRELRS